MAGAQTFDAIVVGAGPAGCACACRLAGAGLEVLLVERGKFAGAKNAWGGAFYGPVLDELFPRLREEAPIERVVTRRRISLMGADECLSVEFSPGKAAGHGFTLLRSKFDRWMASKAEAAGAIVATGLLAEDLLVEGGRVAGVKAGGDELPARVVVACDGVNSLLARKAGLRGAEIKAGDVKLGVKEVILLPAEVIRQRFGLRGDEGMAWEMLGCTRGVPGGAFVYTNRESLSVGVVVQPGALAGARATADELLEGLKRHPAVEWLLEGGKLAEYSAHLVPVGGAGMMPRLHGDGILVAGDAAGLVLSTGLVLEGANFAVASGIAAADAIVAAKKAGDFSAASLARYRAILDEGFVGKDLATFGKAHRFLENPRLYGAYPELFCEVAGKLFTSDGRPRKNAWRLLREAMKGKVSLWRMARDAGGAKGAL